VNLKNKFLVHQDRRQRKWIAMNVRYDIVRRNLVNTKEKYTDSVVDVSALWDSLRLSQKKMQKVWSRLTSSTDEKIYTNRQGHLDQ
jgi:hypothetical protein